MRVIIDANFIKEQILNNKEPDKILKMIQSRRIKGYITQAGLDNICSTSKHYKGEEITDKLIFELEEMLEICPITKNVRGKLNSLHIENPDSRIEVACAIEMQISTLITNNPKNYAEGYLNPSILDYAEEYLNLSILNYTGEEYLNLSILTPREFLKRQSQYEKIQALTVEFKAVTVQLKIGKSDFTTWFKQT